MKKILHCMVIALLLGGVASAEKAPAKEEGASPDTTVQISRQDKLPKVKNVKQKTSWSKIKDLFM